MISGDLVRLHGTMNSSYAREGEMGIILEVFVPGHEHARVLWCKDNQDGICKTEHLEKLS
jgi:hypothetical protein